MLYKFWSEKSGENLPQYSRLPQDDDIQPPSVPREQLHDNTSNQINVFQYIRCFLYLVTGIAFIASFFRAGPEALRSYLDAPSSTSSSITNSSAPTINLILASSTSKTNSTVWTKELEKGNLAVLGIVPPTGSSKGSESLIYLNYIYQNYDSLSAISIFYNEWEETSFPFSGKEMINRLDISAVQSLGFLALCFQDPSSLGVNHSTISGAQSLSFENNFPNNEIPKTFPAPCGKFAVSRDVIHSIPREQYLYHINLLRKTCDTPASGTEWDVMWQYLFSHHTNETPAFKSLCSGWDCVLERRGG